MAISTSIFGVAKETRPAPVEYVGRFRSGYKVGKLPRSLQAWRVTTADPDVAESVSTLYGGEAQEWDATGEDNIEIYTAADRVKILIEPGGIRTGFSLQGANGRIRSCDGARQTWGDFVGEACPCAGLTLEQRKDGASRGTSCRPNIWMKFRLVDAPNLGLFTFSSSSWVLAERIQAMETKVTEAEVAVPATLRLEQVTTKGGKEFTLTRVE